MKRIPLQPVHPERICWGCDKYCPADDLRCGNGTVRTMHPVELFGDDWLEAALGADPDGQPPARSDVAIASSISSGTTTASSPTVNSVE